MKKFGYMLLFGLIFGIAMGVSVYIVKYSSVCSWLSYLAVIICCSATILIYHALIMSERLKKVYGYFAGILTVFIGAITLFILLPPGVWQMVPIGSDSSMYRMVSPLSLVNAIVIFLIPGIIVSFALTTYLWNRD